MDSAPTYEQRLLKEIQEQINQLRERMASKDEVKAMIESALGDRPTRNEVHQIVDSGVSSMRELLQNTTINIEGSNSRTRTDLMTSFEGMKSSYDKMTGQMAGVGEVVRAYQNNVDGVRSDVRSMESSLRKDITRLDEEQKHQIEDVTDLRGGLKKMQEDLAGPDGIKALIKNEVLVGLRGLRSDLDTERQLRITREAEELRRAEQRRKIVQLVSGAAKKFASLPLFWKFALPTLFGLTSGLGIQILNFFIEILQKIN